MPLLGLLEMMNERLTEWINGFIADMEGENPPSPPGGSGRSPKTSPRSTSASTSPRAPQSPRAQPAISPGALWSLESEFWNWMMTFQASGFPLQHIRHHLPTTSPVSPSTACHLPRCSLVLYLGEIMQGLTKK